MKAGDLESLRKMWGEFTSAGPLDALDERLVDAWWHPGLIYVEDPSWPGASSHEGRDAVEAAWNAYFEVLGFAQMAVEEIVEASDEAVVMVRVTGVSKGADVPFDHVWGYVCRMRDGRLSHIRAYWDPDEALAAAGVSSP